MALVAATYYLVTGETGLPLWTQDRNRPNRRSAVTGPGNDPVEPVCPGRETSLRPSLGSGNNQGSRMTEDRMVH